MTKKSLITLSYEELTVDRELEEYLVEISGGKRFADDRGDESIQTLSEQNFDYAYEGGLIDGRIDLATELLSKFKTR